MRRDARVPGEGELADEAATRSLRMTWPSMPLVPGGPSGRRWPTPNRRTSIGTGAPRERQRRRRRRRDDFVRMVVSGCENRSREK